MEVGRGLWVAARVLDKSLQAVQLQVGGKANMQHDAKANE